MQRGDGILAVFIGGITPIPDFILPYLAGFTRMKLPGIYPERWDIAAFLRSLLIGYSDEPARCRPHPIFRSMATCSARSSSSGG